MSIDNDDTGRRPVSGYHMLLNLVEKMDAKLSSVIEKIDAERVARQASEIKAAERFTALETTQKAMQRLISWVATLAATVLAGGILWYVTANNSEPASDRYRGQQPQERHGRDRRADPGQVVPEGAVPRSPSSGL